MRDFFVVSFLKIIQEDVECPTEVQTGLGFFRRHKFF